MECVGFAQPGFGSRGATEVGPTMNASIAVSIVTSFVLHRNGSGCRRREGINTGEVGCAPPVVPEVSPGKCVHATRTFCGNQATLSSPLLFAT